MKSRFFWRVLSLATLVAAPGCADELSGGESEHEEIGSSEEAIYVDTSTLWQQNFVNVCWVNPQPRHASERALVEAAIQNTWEDASSIDFIGWAPCVGLPEGFIKIYVGDGWPYVTSLGAGLGLPVAHMLLKFDNYDSDPNSYCATRRLTCIEDLAIHEFGHALGFAHEQNRPDSDPVCQEEKQGSDGDSVFDPWDQASVMNYCAPGFNGDGNLTPSDRAAAHLFYNDFDAGFADLPRSFVDVNADGHTDYCRFVNLGDGLRLSCALGTSTGFGAPFAFQSAANVDAGWANRPRAFADANGDGRTDYCRFVGSSGNERLSCLLAGTSGFTGTMNDLSSKTDAGWANRPRGFADMNGDGSADYCRFTGSSGSIRLTCTLAQGSTFGINVSSAAGLDSGWANRPRGFTDVNADGRDDFCRFVGPDNKIRLSCALATNSGFDDNFKSADQHFDTGFANRPREFVDVNADGRSDFCRFVGTSDAVRLSCMLANAAGFGAAHGFVSSVGIDTGFADKPRGFADINADNRADFCRVVGTGVGRRLSCMLAGTSSFGAPEGFATEEGYFDPGYGDRPWAFADADDDNRDDLCRIVGQGKGLPACVIAGAASFGYHLEHRATP